MVNASKESRQVLRKKQRDQNKENQVQEKLEINIFNKIQYLLKNVFMERKLNLIAKKTKINQRERKLKPLIIISILMIGCLDDLHSDPIPSLERMCLLLERRFNISVKPQSLQQKINRKETVNFIKEIMSEVLKYETSKAMKKLLQTKKSKIKFFNRILLQDSTVISLPETLKRVFKGCGGAASKAAVKIDFIIDQQNHQIIRVKFTSGKVPDMSMSSDIINLLSKDDLVIRDLGYFNLSHLSTIILKKSFFITRLLKSANVYLNKEDAQPLDLIKHLKKLGATEKKGVDINIYIGKKERLLVRMIAIKVPSEVVEIRREKFKEHDSKKTPSESMREWHGYTILVTNIPKKKMSLNMLLQMYKIRWQIELFFKNMKSHLCVDKLTGKNKYRILCLVYVKVIITLMVTVIYGYAQRIAGNKEVSIIKLTKWLKEDSKIKNAFITGNFINLLEELKKDIHFICKQKRNRKTSLEIITETCFDKKSNRKAA